MKQNTITQTKGHGILRKTKLGLASGIILGTCVCLSLASTTAFANEENPTNTPNSEVTTPTKDDFTKNEVIDVKKDELAAKVEEVKSAGVVLEEKPSESVGTAKNKEDEVSLTKDAEKIVDNEIEALENAKKEASERQVQREKVEKFKEIYTNLPNKRHMLVHHINSRELEEDKEKTKTFSDFNSNLGEVQFVNRKVVDLTKGSTVKTFSSSETTTTPTTIKTRIKAPLSNLRLYGPERSRVTDAYILKVRDGETISYNTKLDQESYLRKTYGIDTISIKRTYNFDLTNDPIYYDVLTDKMIERAYILSNISKATNPAEGNPSVTTEYTYKDATGNVIPLKDLYTKVMNDSIFNGKNVLKTEEISNESISAPEHVNVVDSESEFIFTSYDGSITKDGGVLQTFNYMYRKSQNLSSLLTTAASTFNKKNLLNNVDYENVMKPVKSDYHFVTLNKVTDTGLVIQKFVDENGKEIAPSITSDKQEKGSVFTLSTPPKELKNQEQSYLLKGDYPSSVTVEKGLNTITYTYKLQVFTEKGTPETTTNTDFEGGVNPLDPPILEVPEYTAPIGTAGTPEVYEKPEFNGGTVPMDTPVLDVPEYNGAISMVGEPLVNEKPEFNGGTVPMDAPVLDAPEYNGVISMVGEPLVNEKPEYTGAATPLDSPVLKVPEYTAPIGAAGTPEVHEKPEFNGGTVPMDAPVLDVPAIEVVNTPKQPNSEQKAEKPSTTELLPNTGVEENNILQAIGLGLLSSFGLVALTSRKKQD